MAPCLRGIMSIASCRMYHFLLVECNYANHAINRTMPEGVLGELGTRSTFHKITQM
jgi:hypothetical protein